MAAGIQAKVTTGAPDGTRGNDWAAAGCQPPGTGHLGPADGAAEAVGLAQVQGVSLTVEQVCPLLERHGPQATDELEAKDSSIAERLNLQGGSENGVHGEGRPFIVLQL